MKDRYDDKDLTKVLHLLAEAKHALDAACEAAEAYAEADEEVRHVREMIEDEKQYASENPDEDFTDEIRGLTERLERATATREKAKEEFVSHARTLDDELGSAGRVADHYNGKVYPFGMSPL